MLERNVQIRWGDGEVEGCLCRDGFPGDFNCRRHSRNDMRRGEVNFHVSVSDGLFRGKLSGYGWIGALLALTGELRLL